MSYKIWCLGFVFSHDLQSVVLIKKIRSLHIGLWNGVGGKVENGETYPDSMVRECKEESGIETKENEWEDVGTLSGDDWKVWVMALKHPSDLKTNPEFMEPKENLVLLPLKFLSDIRTNSAPFLFPLVHAAQELLLRRENTLFNIGV